jgi:hypothetical protein
MEIDKKIEYGKKFKERFEKEIKEISFKDFDKLFFAENFFLYTNTPYFDVICSNIS